MRTAEISGEKFDLLVIGGGITGCGVARDAAMRGLKVALIERDDFASGTSGRSSRLIHGGIRYLEQGQLHLVRESIRACRKGETERRAARLSAHGLGTIEKALDAERARDTGP